ncbi:hypothetical protein HPB50_003631 [Hyalomma asiaticum]|uniref:Uncharacterized protein n=1 Tax=Hyalomma asiaticum TaxID=266040 RepID=A0ACB7TE42_HYAAI|nr:hypothetical protein HPB50_003631 [Hyalomma asiaticum]
MRRKHDAQNRHRTPPQPTTPPETTFSAGDCVSDVDLRLRVDSSDIHEFLVRWTSFITRDQMKSRKALKGHNFVTSGLREPWVKKVAAYTVIVVTQGMLASGCDRTRYLNASKATAIPRIFSFEEANFVRAAVARWHDPETEAHAPVICGDHPTPECRARGDRRRRFTDRTGQRLPSLSLLAGTGRLSCYRAIYGGNARVRLAIFKDARPPLGKYAL